jgi:hypothetical protein
MTDDEISTAFTVAFDNSKHPSFNVVDYTIFDGMITLTMCNRKSSFEELNMLKLIKLRGYSRKGKELYLIHINLESSELSRIDIKNGDVWFKISLPIKEIYYVNC